MHSSRVSVGARAGVVAWAATTGAVLGLGLRHGAATEPFAAAGTSVLASLGFVTGVTPAVAAAVGMALHLAWVVVWGVCFTSVAGTLRGPRLALAAAALALLLWVLSARAEPSTLRASGVLSLSSAQLLLVNLLLALGLALGMRVAQLGSRVR